MSIFDMPPLPKFEVDIKTDIDTPMWVLHMLNTPILPDKPRYVGKRTDENGVEHEVWQHSFVFPSQRVTLHTSAELRDRRRNKLKKRQRRVAQRKHRRSKR